jgi:hypothetical protein
MMLVDIYGNIYIYYVNDNQVMEYESNDIGYSVFKINLEE